LKRFISIVRKLIWEPTRFTQMQDVGGCRVVLNNLTLAEQLTKELLKTLPHDLVDADDYIKTPAQSGYRGVHLIYKYRPESKDAEVYRGMKIEIQIRTDLQHAWATAVEVAETCTGYALKDSRGRVDENYVRFFQLVSSALALREGTPLVPGVPADVEELCVFEEMLGVRGKLAAYGAATDEGLSFPPGAEYYLLDLDTSGSRSVTTIKGFTRDQLDEANAEYAEADRQIQESDERQVVLVSASSVSQLRSAYPNYFLDSRAFISVVDQILGEA